MPSLAKQDLLGRWRTAAHRYLDEAERETVAGNVQRWTISAGIATDKVRDLDAKPLVTVQHVHTVDLGVLAAGFAEVTRRLAGAHPVPQVVDASFVPLALPVEHGGAVGQAGDVGMSSGVPRRQAGAGKNAALSQSRGGGPHHAGLSDDPTTGGGASGPTNTLKRKPRGSYKRHKPVLPEVDPLKPLARASLKLRRKAARMKRDA